MPLSNRALSTLDRTKLYLRREDVDDANEDSQLEGLIEGYSSAINKKLVGREFYAVPPTDPETRTFAYSGDGAFFFPGELRSASEVKLDGTDLVEWQSYLLQPVQQTDEGTYTWINLPQSSLNKNTRLPDYYVTRFSKLEVTGLWGTSVPPAVEQALWICVANKFLNKGGFQAQQIGAGMHFAELADVNGVWSLTPDALRLITPFSRPNG
jgi:hypothetical protein